MKTPPFLMAAALLFWGWQTDLLAVGAALGVALEASRVVATRWEFAPTELRRIWSLCVVLFVGAGVIAFASQDAGRALTDLLGTSSPARRVEAANQTGRAALRLFQWLPIALFPVMAAQAFGTAEQIDVRNFSWVLRRLDRVGPRGRWPAAFRLNVSFPYFALVLLGASTTQQHPRAYFWGLCGLIACALWSQRNRRYAGPVWLALLVLTAAAGYFGQHAVLWLQGRLEGLDSALIARFAPRPRDNTETRSMLGSLGRVKLSGRIALRVETDGQAPPPLLREASFNVYRSSLWYLRKHEFKPLLPENDETTWLLSTNRESSRAATLWRYLDGGRGVLPAPRGVFRLENLPVFILETNHMSVLRVGSGPGLVGYRACYDEGPSLDTPANKDDLVIPPEEDKLITQIAGELGLTNRESPAPSSALTTVANYLATHFDYATYFDRPRRRRGPQTPLATFLLEERRGHCEYFATAAALLLRKAGIPVRYAVGYAVMEGSKGQFVVRERHAHAWCLAYYHGAWHDFDPTPGTWRAVEERRASFLQPLSDLQSKLWFEFSKWRWERADVRRPLIWGVLALLFILGVRIWRQGRWSRARPAQNVPPAERAWPGHDSELYRAEAALAALGLGRHEGETAAHWLQRIEPASPAPTLALQRVLPFHYRLRFDPDRITAGERAALRAGVESWMIDSGSVRTLVNKSPIGSRG